MIITTAVALMQVSAGISFLEARAIKIPFVAVGPLFSYG